MLDGTDGGGYNKRLDNANAPAVNNANAAEPVPIVNAPPVWLVPVCCAPAEPLVVLPEAPVVWAPEAAADPDAEALAPDEGEAAAEEPGGATAETAATDDHLAAEFVESWPSWYGKNEMAPVLSSCTSAVMLAAYVAFASFVEGPAKD